MKGLYNKFLVQYFQGATPSGARFFVLRLDTDKHARVAALAYADSVEKENKALAEDLRNLIDEYE
jgi:hypothetical protein